MTKPVDKKTNYLKLSPEEFKKGYDYNITNLVAPDYNKNQYIPVHLLVPVMARLFPNLVVSSTDVQEHKATDGSIIGATINIIITDVLTGEQTPVHHFPVMLHDGKRSSATNLDARSLNDNRQRGITRAIANCTGLGLRLWTREGIDVNKGDCKHIKWAYLSKLAIMQDDYETKYGLPDGYVPPDFGMSLEKLKTYSWLKEEPTTK